MPAAARGAAARAAVPLPGPGAPVMPSESAMCCAEGGVAAQSSSRIRSTIFAVDTP